MDHKIIRHQGKDQAKQQMCLYTFKKKSSNNVSLPTTSYACYFEHLI